MISIHNCSVFVVFVLLFLLLFINTGHNNNNNNNNNSQTSIVHDGARCVASSTEMAG